MTISVKYSQSPDAIRKRIARLPAYGVALVDNIMQRAAENVVKNFENGIAYRKFSLQVLAPYTIYKKQQKGYDKPHTPLYGEGKNNEDSYHVALEVVPDKVSGGKQFHTVKPKKTNHHSGLPYRSILMIHEYGATIAVPKADGGSTLIRIPPRPAFRLAYEKEMRRFKVGEVSDQVTKAINTLVKTGREISAQQIAKQSEVKD